MKYRDVYCSESLLIQMVNQILEHRFIDKSSKFSDDEYEHRHYPMTGRLTYRSENEYNWKIWYMWHPCSYFPIHKICWIDDEWKSTA